MVILRPAQHARRPRGGLASMLAVLAVLTSAGLMTYLMLARGGVGGATGGATPSAAASDAGFQAALLAAGLVTTADGLSIAEVCRQEDSDAMATFMAQELLPQGWTSCHDSTWLKKFQEIADPARNRTFIDIGCNKGYSSAEMFALFDPELGFKPNTIRQWESTVECGACSDCEQDAVPAKPPPPGQPPALQGVCVEPNQLSFATLIRMREHFFSKSRQQWHLVNAAIGNGTSRTVRFPRCPAGNELCGLNSVLASEKSQFIVGHDVIPLWSVDALLQMYNLQYVDVLKIDTEGYDVQALASGMASLLGRKAGIIAFKYHGLGAWQHHRLESVVQRLNGLNYVCYFSGTLVCSKAGEAGSLARLTGCWSQRYEFHSWSNVVCIQRTHELYPHAERLSTRYARHRSLYYSGGGPPP